MSPDRPRLRRDLEATPIEAEGQKFVDVHDPTTGGTFRFYEFEYRVALAFDGLPFDRVIPWLRLSAGLDYQEAQLREFAAYLHDMGFLESSPTGVRIAPAPAEPETAASADEEPASSDEWDDQSRAATVQVPAESLAWPAELATAAPAPALPEPPLAEVEAELEEPTEAGSPTAVAPAPALSLEEVPTVPAGVEMVLAGTVAAPAPQLPATVEERRPPSDALAAPPSAPGEAPSSAQVPPSDELMAAASEAAEPSVAPPESAPVTLGAPPDPTLLDGADGLPAVSGERTTGTEAGVDGAGALPVEEAAPSPSQVVHEAVVAVEEPGAQPMEEAAPSPSQVVHEAVAAEATPEPDPSGAHPATEVGRWPWQMAQEGAGAAEPAPAGTSPGAGETQDGYAPAAVPEPASPAAPASAETLDGFAPVDEEAPAQVGPAPQRPFTEIVLDGITPPVEEVPPLPPHLRPAAVVTVPEPATGSAATRPAVADAAARSPEAGVAPAPEPAAAAEPAALPAAAQAGLAEPASPRAGKPDEAATESPSATAFGLSVETQRDSTPEPAARGAEGEPRLPLEAAFEHVPEARHLDSMAFPVLPTPPPESVGHFPPRRSSSAAWPVQQGLRTPPPVTPPPITMGPLRAAQQVAERRQQRRSLLLFGSLGVIAAVALLAVLVPLFFPSRTPPRAEVRTVVASPGTVLRYFLGNGAIAAMPGMVHKFPAAGVVTRIAKTGSVVAAGDVVAAVEAARPLLSQLTHLRERLAFYQQIADAMHQVGNTGEEEKNAANVEVRRAKVAKTLRALADVAVVSTGPGEVEEAFVREGDRVEAGGLALRMRSTGHRAIFELPRALAAEARRLGFCQVSVDGYVLDCRPVPEQEDDGRVSVDIAALPPTLLGRPARLARARFDGAVALPASAVQSAGRRNQVLVVSPFGRLESRAVAVAEQNAAEAVVVQGLDSGENVVVEPTNDLRPGMQVTVRP